MNQTIVRPLVYKRYGKKFGIVMNMDGFITFYINKFIRHNRKNQPVENFVFYRYTCPETSKTIKYTFKDFENENIREKLFRLRKNKNTHEYNHPEAIPHAFAWHELLKNGNFEKIPFYNENVYLNVKRGSYRKFNIDHAVAYFDNQEELIKTVTDFIIPYKKTVRKYENLSTNDFFEIKEIHLPVAEKYEYDGDIDVSYLEEKMFPCFAKNQGIKMIIVKKDGKLIEYFTEMFNLSDMDSVLMKFKRETIKYMIKYKRMDKRYKVEFRVVLPLLKENRDYYNRITDMVISRLPQKLVIRKSQIFSNMKDLAFF